MMCGAMSAGTQSYIGSEKLEFRERPLARIRGPDFGKSSLNDTRERPLHYTPVQAAALLVIETLPRRVRACVRGVLVALVPSSRGTRVVSDEPRNSRETNGLCGQ